MAGPDGASLEASLAVAEAVVSARQPRRWAPELRDLTVTNFGGSRGRPGYEELKLTFGARLLTLIFASETQQVTAEIPLAP